MVSLNKLDIIENVTSGSPNRLRESYFSKYHNDLYNEIMNFTKNIDVKFQFRVWHWVNNEPNYIKCSCGNRVSPKMNWKEGYKQYCSNKCSSNSELTKNKLKETALKKWGVEHYSKTDEYVEKVRKTSLDRYGVDNYSKTDEYVEKSKKTYLEKWGVDNFTKTDEFLEKSKKTSLEKWGFEFPIQSDIIKCKIRETNKERWGASHIFQSEDYRKLNFKIANDVNYIEFSEGYNKFKCDCDKNHIFKISTDDYYGRKHSGNKLCTLCNPISDSSSLKEKMLYEYIESFYGGEIIRGYKDGRLEIDIYLLDLNLGFEFNGLWWHSDKYKDKYYHINKTKYFEERDIRIIHIWEDDWVNKTNIIKSQIKNWIGLTTNKIFARKCDIKVVDSKRANKFLNENHIQGSDKSKIKIGLYYGDELVSLMTFNQFEGRNKMEFSEWNLSRFCNKKDHNIIGSASKLLNYFIKNWETKRIISYSDRDWSLGKLYYKLGFEKVYETEPDYKYLFKEKRLHKSNFRKSKTGISESVLNVPKIWDCGKIKFEKIIK
jgi:hypothetical protein